MLQIRQKLAQYQEYFYLAFLLSMAGLVSAGFTSEDKIYKIIFAIATLCLLLKIAVTDFTLKEFLCMAVITLLAGINLLRNGEKTLIISLMAIFGIKNVSLDKVLLYSLWSKVVLTCGRFLLVFLGVVENEVIVLPKNYQSIELYCYGYYHPNIAFANILLLFAIAILVYKDRLRWYVYAIFTFIMYAAYKILMCRTGLVIYAGLLLMLLFYAISRKLKLEKLYLYLCLAIPVLMAALTFVFPVLAMTNQQFQQTVNYYLTGRIWHIMMYWDSMGALILGHTPREPFDSIYFHLAYNYGWIMFAIVLLAYIGAMWKCIKQEQHYAVIILAVLSVYGFMEHWPLSVLWNIPLLYLSNMLFTQPQTSPPQ